MSNEIHAEATSASKEMIESRLEVNRLVKRTMLIVFGSIILMVICFAILPYVSVHIMSISAVEEAKMFKEIQENLSKFVWAFLRNYCFMVVILALFTKMSIKKREKEKMQDLIDSYKGE